MTGDRSPAMFHVMTLELEKCLNGEGHVRVPNASHNMHSANPRFFTDSVKAFLQQGLESAR